MSSAFDRYMKRRTLLSLAAISALTLGGAVYYRSTLKAEAPRFMTAEVTRGDVVQTVEATGTLEAVTTVQVGSQVSGTIASLHADFNSIVRKGDVVARLDPSLMQAQVDQAEATIVRLDAEVDRARVALDDANVKLRRAKDLFEQRLIAKMDLDSADATAAQAQAAVKSAQAQVTQARASLNQNRVNLSHTVITAPVDGVVISRNVDVGQTVAASMSAPVLFVIAKNLSEMQVNASIDEADIGQIESGQSVTFKVDAYPRETFTGTVSQVRLAPVVAQNVVSYVTVIDVPNKELKLKPGMTANVTVEIARADAVLRVQNAALRFQPPADVARTDSERGRRVWVLAGGELQPVRVRTGISDGTTTAIVDGSLDEHAQVVTGIVATQASSSAPSSASPLIPQRPGFNRQQGGNNTRRPASGAGR